MVDASAHVRRFAPGTASAALVLLLATACSSSGGGTAAGSSPGSATSSGSPSASATPSGVSASSSASAPACGSGLSPTISGTGPADTAKAGAAVAADYRTFFDPSTPADTKVGLLENGALLQPVLAGFAGNPLAAKATVTVLTVDFTSATTADLTFNLCEGGTPALPGSQGKSVLEGGVWKVADATLCSLVDLNNGGSAAPGCS